MSKAQFWTSSLSFIPWMISPNSMALNIIHVLVISIVTVPALFSLLRLRLICPTAYSSSLIRYIMGILNLTIPKTELLIPFCSAPFLYWSSLFQQKKKIPQSTQLLSHMPEGPSYSFLYTVSTTATLVQATILPTRPTGPLSGLPSFILDTLIHTVARPI